MYYIKYPSASATVGDPELYLTNSVPYDSGSNTILGFSADHEPNWVDVLPIVNSENFLVLPNNLYLDGDLVKKTAAIVLDFGAPMAIVLPNDDHASFALKVNKICKADPVCGGVAAKDSTYQPPLTVSCGL